LGLCTEKLVCKQAPLTDDLGKTALWKREREEAGVCPRNQWEECRHEAEPAPLLGVVIQHREVYEEVRIVRIHLKGPDWDGLLSHDDAWRPVLRTLLKRFNLCQQMTPTFLLYVCVRFFRHS
jgi:hypothetical protein